MSSGRRNRPRLSSITLSPLRDPVVLLIDDEDVVCRLIHMQLEDEAPDIKLEVCKASVLALEHALRLEPSVMLLDLVMPQVDGLTLLRFFKSHPMLRRIPIIMLSGQEDAGVKTTAFDSGADDYLVKVPQSGELIARIRHHSHMYRSAIERERVGQERLQAEIDRVRLLSHALMSIGDSVFMLDARDRIVFVNKAFSSTYGWAAEDIVGQTCDILGEVPTDPDRSEPRPPGREGGDPRDRPVMQRCQDGRRFPALMTRSPVGDGMTVVVARDVSEAQRAQEALRQSEEVVREKNAQLAQSLAEKELLLREIHHRVKNNLQITASLLKLQIARFPDPAVRQMLEESQHRIRSMALVHEQLYQSNDLARISVRAYVRNLVANLSRSYGVGSRIQVQVDVEDVQIGVDLAVPCGLLINELISNGFKHAFPHGRSGRMTVTMFSDGRNGILEVADDGVGLPPNLDLESDNSLGLYLISNLTRQLDGTLQVQNSPGAVFYIVFPLS